MNDDYKFLILILFSFLIFIKIKQNNLKKMIFNFIFIRKKLFLLNNLIHHQYYYFVELIKYYYLFSVVNLLIYIKCLSYKAY